jgi:hypothetical protein
MLIVASVCAVIGAVFGAGLAWRWPLIYLFRFFLGDGAGEEQLINAGAIGGAIIGAVAALLAWYRNRY